VVLFLHFFWPAGRWCWFCKKKIAGRELVLVLQFFFGRLGGGAGSANFLAIVTIDAPSE
jgi:hypothetical protein